ncbi:MAG: hypothetical protein ACI30V_10490 [Muribaculaceae bacterium]
MKAYNSILSLFVACCLLIIVAGSCGRGEMTGDVIASNDVFAVTGDSVVEGRYWAYAPNRSTIVSNYVDTLSLHPSSPIAFRLAFNMRDNEMAPGLFHYIDVDADTVTVTACVPDTLAHYAVHTARSDWHCTLRVDLRQMLSDFSSKGVWVTAKGDSIFSVEFNGVWVIGNVKPLSWDLLPLAQNNRSKLRPSDREGFYELDINFAPTEYVRSSQFTGWKSDGENKTFAKVQTADVLVDALYNMAVETIDRADFSSMNQSELSLASLLVLAEAKPELCMQLLRSKVEGGVIRQDLNGRFTFPVVNDRLIWACAAWQVYLATGNQRWLKYAHKVILATLEQIEQVSFCQTMHLVHGCDSYSSPELQYPRWMQPKDYYESMRLSTNAIYARCLYVLSLIDEELFLDSEQHYLAYRRVKDSINQTMWNESLGRYCSFLIDEAFARQSNFTCNLTQAACVLFDIADDDRATTLVARTPFYLTGIPTIYPSRHSAPMGNQAAFVQGLWNLAAAHAENQLALRYGLAALYRWAAFNGFSSAAASPQHNLLAACAVAAMSLKITAGITLSPEGIEFNPVVPEGLAGAKTISGIRYRGASFNLTIIGTGSAIKRFELDGKPLNTNFLHSDIIGEHNIVITLEDPVQPATQHVNISQPAMCPFTPEVQWDGDSARIVNFNRNLTYSVVINNRSFSGVHKVFSVPVEEENKPLSIIYVVARGGGIVSQASQPREFVSPSALTTYPLASFATAGTKLLPAHLGKQVVEFSADGISEITIPAFAQRAGYYYLDVHYSCGSSSASITPMCQVWVNTHRQDVLVLPALGANQWRTFGYSNRIKVALLAGKNTIRLQYFSPRASRIAKTPTVLLRSLRLIAQ